MKRVLVILRQLVLGGAELQALALAAGLARRGLDVHVATLHPGGGGAAAAPAEGVAVHDLPRRGGTVGAALAAVGLARRVRPDAVLGYLDLPNHLAVACARAAGATAAMGLRASAVEVDHLPFVARVLYRTEPRVARLGDLVIANAETVKRDAVARGFPAARIHVVPNGVDTDRFRPTCPELRVAMRRELGLPLEATVVARLGRLHPMKGGDLFVDAAAQLAAARDDLHALVVGDGPDDERRALLRRARGTALEGRLHLVGARRDIERVYAAVDVVVSSSIYGEGFPNVVAEAMAAGVRCVATDVGDSAVVLGDVGWVTTPDASALADACASALDAGPEAGTAGRARIVAEFGVEQLVDRTLAVLEGAR